MHDTIYECKEFYLHNSELKISIIKFNHFFNINFESQFYGDKLLCKKDQSLWGQVACIEDQSIWGHNVQRMNVSGHQCTYEDMMYV